ncbi:MAG: MMPL family transporter [Segniliparus sp.]|uniref:MMPL family transporter n=1 Tax=Segniliparus sp. TaxID=2804064 RepID=UPI003F3B6385
MGRPHGESSPFMGRVGRFCARRAWWVVGFWAVLIGMLNLVVPQLEKTVGQHSAPFIPGNIQSTKTLLQMSKDFGVQQSTSIGSVVVVDEHGFGPAEEAFVRRLVDALQADKENVSFVLDTYHNEQTKSIALSPDGKAINFIVAGTGDVGSTKAHQNVNTTRAMIAGLAKPPGLEVYYTGSAPELADLFTAMDSSLVVITGVSVVLISLLLFAVYRSFVTASVPLLTIGYALGLARPVVSWLGLHGALPISNFTISLMTAMILGGVTDYAIFAVAAYHEARRDELPVVDAVARSAAKTSPIVVASVLTIAAAALSMVFAEVGMFKTAGPPIAIGIGLGLFVASTLPYALLAILGKRGLAEPRPLDERKWRRTGVRIIRHSRALTAAALALLLALASVLLTFRMNFDENAMQLRHSESAAGFEKVDRHWGVNEASPDFLIVRADHDMRDTDDLAALELIAMSVAKLPEVAYVRSMTRPTGEPLGQTAIGYQVGVVGGRLGEANDQLTRSAPQLARLAAGVGRLRSGAGSASAQLPQLVSGVQQLAGLAHGLLDSYQRADQSIHAATGGEYGAKSAVSDLGGSVDLLESTLADMDEALRNNGLLFWAITTINTFLGPVAAEDLGPDCAPNPICSKLHADLAELDRTSNGSLGRALRLLHDMGGDPLGSIQRAQDSLPALRASLASVQSLLNQVSGKSPDQVKAQLAQLVGGTERLAGGMAQLVGGLNQVQTGMDQVLDLTNQLGAGLQTASDYLSQVGQHTSQGPGSGFYLPPQGFEDPGFKAGSELLFSPDGKSARMIVVWKGNAAGYETINATRKVGETARNMAKGTVLENAQFHSTGLASLSADMRDQVWRDFTIFGIVAVIGVLLVLIVLLRSILAPLLMVGTVVLSYAAAMGASVLVWQHILHIDLDWAALPVSFMALIAVGSDYSMLFALRIREESEHRGMLQGLVRGFGSTGSVITTAGVVFAITMFALMSGSVMNLLQIGFAIGVGLLLDITVVRTILVPAMLALVGDQIWWPSASSARRTRRAEARTP